ncbi:LysR family transcriptional regulator [Alicyclobacillus fodiniaquatilis]|uniref:LysR family transcriptional regulator n=1 Tax=Alicyclobacillus fodiniaquatilis TaxID=1661150 RepID=A0ABW4JSE3_9BACL
MIANLELYRVFYWTAREGNFSRAAERLFITQPSVSHAIKQLERELDITLFYRGSRGVTLTDEGKLMFEYVEQMFNMLESAERHIAEINDLMSGELRVGGSDSLCKYYLLPALSQFCHDFPKIRLDLAHGTTPEIVQFVKEGKIDLGVVRLPLDDDALIIHPAISVQDCFVAGPRFAELAKQTIALKDLAEYPLILFTKTSSSRNFIEEFARSLSIDLQPDIELASVDLLIAFAKAGLGISFVTKQFVSRELENRALFEINLRESIPNRTIGLIYLKNRRLSPASRKFVEDYLRLTPDFRT